MANLNEVTSEQLISELERRGYVLGNAWRVEDVSGHLEFLNDMYPDAKVTLTDAECHGIITEVLNYDGYYEWVNERISEVLQTDYFPQKVS